MKTLVVLCSLVAIAIAAPALQDEIIEDIDHTQDWNIHLQPSLQDTLKREKKSPLDQSSSSLLHADVPSTEIHIDSGLPTPTARSFGLKKPVIVKKKYGYRLYRDSDEEMANADSHESCGRQVKVKLCDEDGKFREMLRSTGQEITDIHSSEDEMKNSIMMAKEAVENLQRDLKKMEQKSDSMKMAHESETDAALHEDIEVARQALDHIHKNFGTLEPTNLHTTATKDSETTHDLHVTVARSEEEKMAQWKEAMDTIQRNVEIVRDIEDSFKVADQSQTHFDQSQSPSTINEQRMEDNAPSHATLGENHMRGVETTDLLPQTPAQENHHKQLHHDAIINEHHAREDQHIEDDMRPSASEAIEMKAVDIENHNTFRSDSHKHHEHQQITEAKSSELKPVQYIEKTQGHILPKSSELPLNLAIPTETTKHLHSLLKETEEPNETKLDTQKDALFKSSENSGDISMAPLLDAINTFNAEALSEHHQRNTEMIEASDKAEHHLKHEKVPTMSVKHIEPIHQDTNMREVAEGFTHQLKPLHLENFETNSMHSSHGVLRENEDIVPKGHIVHHIEENFMKAAHPLDHPALESIRVQHKHHNIDYNETEEDATRKLPGMKSADNQLLHPLTALHSADGHHHHHHHHLANMKATENHLHHLESEPVHAHWAQEGRHLPSMKVASGYRKEIHEMDHKGNMHLPEHHFGSNKMGMTSDFDMSDHSHHQHQHPHFPQRYHENSMSHSQMHESNNIRGGAMSPNNHSSMRDAMEALESEHMFRWKPAHESRNAYGAGISGSIGSSIGSSSGAVGVFPTANTGGCGIPLLLSCSPSVVSGSLAKAHSAGPAYAAPSYRTEEDFSFHNKRDIKKTSELSSSNILRTPAIVKQKSATVLENSM